MRARCLIPEGWTTTHRLQLLEDIIDPRDLTKVFDRAGRVVGVGDWRPIYGTFTTEVGE